MTNVGISGFGLRGLVVAELRARQLDVSDNNAGIVALKRLRGEDVTVNDTNGRGISGGHVQITRLQVHGNQFAGVIGTRLTLIDSDVTGNDLAFGEGIDIGSLRRPRLVNTICGKSQVDSAPAGTSWGVCQND
jgi:hypothetical protein